MVLALPDYSISSGSSNINGGRSSGSGRAWELGAINLQDRAYAPINVQNMAMAKESSFHVSAAQPDLMHTLISESISSFVDANCIVEAEQPDSAST